MDESVVRRIQKEGAEALLNAGVSVPLKEFRLPFKKKPGYIPAHRFVKTLVMTTFIMPHS